MVLKLTQVLPMAKQSVILHQVTNGIAVRMAVLALAMQGQLQEKGLLEAIAG